MIAYHLYIVDDERSIRDGLGFGLKKYYQVKTFAAAEEALAEMAADRPDLVLLDIGLPGMSGLEALKEIKARCPDILVIIITAFEDIETVIAAMKAGANDYVVKPLQLDTLKICVDNALETVTLRKQIQDLQAQHLKEHMPCFVAESNAIQDVMLFVEKVAKSPDTPILIVGETGTGKELIASTIHYKSPNFKGPFVAINCASIPKDLIESELFGYERGAFSGAAASGKRGLVEEAAEGTLFLDEVGDLSLPAQAKLLRFLEEGAYYRVGGAQQHLITTRVVSATNKDLERLIADGQFRQDLYYRLAVITVRVPSLNERRDDIMPIARHFLYEFGRKFGKQVARIAPEAQAFLLNYQWRGNIRELRNLIERAVLVGSGPELSLADLGIQQTLPAAPAGGFPELPEEGLDLTALDEHFIRAAYRKAGGNEKEAARLLRLSYYAFRYRRKQLNELT